MEDLLEHDARELTVISKLRVNLLHAPFRAFDWASSSSRSGSSSEPPSRINSE